MTANVAAVLGTFIPAELPEHPTLAHLTTTGTGGPVKNYVQTHRLEEFCQDTPDQPGLLVLGGGSNIVAISPEFVGTVVRDMRCELEVTPGSGSGPGPGPWARVTASAGYLWDDLVVQAVLEGWQGFEALSGIPGTVGAAPVQNIGAYGHEVASLIESVTVWDRLTARRLTIPASDLGFGYRTSHLKRSRWEPWRWQQSQQPGPQHQATVPNAENASLSPNPQLIAPAEPTGRYIVLEVTFAVQMGRMSAPVRYQELATLLGVPLEQQVPAADARQAVLQLRRGKGMVLDEAQADTRSSGSFFTNPVLPLAQAQALPEGAPRFPASGPSQGISSVLPTAADSGPGWVKTSAAYLIAQAGFSKGFALPGSAARLSTRHVLALCNGGGATGAEIAQLAEYVQKTVHAAFGVVLEPEPVLV